MILTCTTHSSVFEEKRTTTKSRTNKSLNYFYFQNQMMRMYYL